MIHKWNNESDNIGDLIPLGTIHRDRREKPTVQRGLFQFL